MKIVLTYDEMYPVYRINKHQEILAKVEAHEAALAACATEGEREALRDSSDVHYDTVLDIPCEIVLNYNKAYEAFIEAHTKLERAITYEAFIKAHPWRQ